MAREIFDRETMLDLTVNIIPLFIILFFVVGFAVFAPFGFEPTGLGTIMQYVLLLFPFVALVVLTYFSAKVIVRDERAQESDATDPAELDGESEAESAIDAGESHTNDRESEPAADGDADDERPA